MVGYSCVFGWHWHCCLVRPPCALMSGFRVVPAYLGSQSSCSGPPPLFRLLIPLLLAGAGRHPVCIMYHLRDCGRSGDELRRYSQVPFRTQSSKACSKTGCALDTVKRAGVRSLPCYRARAVYYTGRGPCPHQTWRDLKPLLRSGLSPPIHGEAGAVVDLIRRCGPGSPMDRRR